MRKVAGAPNMFSVMILVMVTWVYIHLLKDIKLQTKIYAFTPQQKNKSTESKVTCYGRKK